MFSRALSLLKPEILLCLIYIKLFRAGKMIDPAVTRSTKRKRVSTQPFKQGINPGEALPNKKRRPLPQDRRIAKITAKRGYRKALSRSAAGLLSLLLT